jgi:hypothetical protein
MGEHVLHYSRTIRPGYWIPERLEPEETYLYLESAPRVVLTGGFVISNMFHEPLWGNEAFGVMALDDGRPAINPKGFWWGALLIDVNALLEGSAGI